MNKKPGIDVFSLENIDFSKYSKTSKELKRFRKCRFCETKKGLIRKYNLYICRRCFKNFAENLGFKKLD
ncbi:MAG: 30S ribosomal protein S14 [archaeon]